ncbi:MAG: CopG family transcriptional regulator [Nevskiales bacterium]
MSRKIKYTNESIGDVKVVRDFLPPPDQLVLHEDGVKVTISLSKRSVDFFKQAAERNKTSYQRMIRRLLDTYADQYTEGGHGRR